MTITTPEPENLPPPSFDASEAAEAIGGTARAGEVSMSRQASIPLEPVIRSGDRAGEAPPGYFGQGGDGHGHGPGGGHGGLPPYS